MIQSSPQVWPGVAKFLSIQFGGWAVRASVTNPNGRQVKLAKPETAVHRAKRDSDKLGDEAGDQTGGYALKVRSLKVFHYINC